MAIEEEMKALTTALNRNSDLLERITASAKAKLDGGDTKPAGKPAAGGTKAADEEAPKPRVARAPKEKPLLPADMSKATTDFLEVEDEAEYADRRAFVKKIITKFGADKMSTIEESDRAAALAYITAYKAGDATDLDEDDIA